VRPQAGGFYGGWVTAMQEGDHGVDLGAAL